MRRGKMWLIRNILLCTIGILFILLSFMLVGFDTKKLGNSNTYKVIEKKYEVNGIHKIRFYGERENIKVEASEDGMIHIRYIEDKKMYSKMHVYSLTNQMTFQRDFRISLHLNPFSSSFNRKEDTLLKIPSNINVEIETSSGNISVKKVDLNALSIKTQSGNIKVEDGKIGDIQIQSTRGNVEVDKVNTSTLLCQTTTGNIYLSMPGFRSEYEILAQSSKKGLLEESKERRDKKININTGRGEIQIHFSEP